MKREREREREVMMKFHSPESFSCICKLQMPVSWTSFYLHYLLLWSVFCSPFQCLKEAIISSFESSFEHTFKWLLISFQWNNTVLRLSCCFFLQSSLFILVTRIESRKEISSGFRLEMRDDYMVFLAKWRNFTRTDWMNEVPCVSCRFEIISTTAMHLIFFGALILSLNSLPVDFARETTRRRLSWLVCKAVFSRIAFSRRFFFIWVSNVFVLQKKGNAEKT